MSAMGGIYNNPTSLIDSPDGHGPVSGTENPLWMDKKYTAYEEQELTMTVFSDQVSLLLNTHKIIDLMVDLYRITVS